jgi:hypothetical protein
MPERGPAATNSQYRQQQHPLNLKGDASFEPACTAREHARNAQVNARLFSSISSEMTRTIPPNCSEARRFVSRCVISPQLGGGAHCRRSVRRQSAGAGLAPAPRTGGSVPSVSAGPSSCCRSRTGAAGPERCSLVAAPWRSRGGLRRGASTPGTRGVRALAAVVARLLAAAEERAPDPLPTAGDDPPVRRTTAQRGGRDRAVRSSAQGWRHAASAGVRPGRQLAPAAWW